MAVVVGFVELGVGVQELLLVGFLVLLRVLWHDEPWKLFAGMSFSPTTACDVVPVVSLPFLLIMDGLNKPVILLLIAVRL